jgi:hypothetical protein
MLLLVVHPPSGKRAGSSALIDVPPTAWQAIVGSHLHPISSPVRHAQMPEAAIPKTHEANERAMKHLQATFSSWRLVDVTADDIEQYLRSWLKRRARVKTKSGF